MKTKLTQQLKILIQKQYPRSKPEVTLEYPPDPKMGDLALPCFELAKIAKQKPNEVAQKLAKELKSDLVAKTQVLGPYLNFFLNKESFWREILGNKKSEIRPLKSELRVMVEFSSPNTNKPLHLGHLRNIALGDSLSHILESVGHKVTRASLVNDRGVHICKSMLAYQKSEVRSQMSDNAKGDHVVGDYYVLFNKMVQKNPKLMDEVQVMLKKWEAGDKEIMALWKKMNKMVLKGFDQTYQRLGIKFDKTYFESQEFENGKKIILSQLKKGKVHKRKDGAIEIDLEKYGLDKKVLIRPDGTSVYITQDIGLAVNRQKNLKLDKIIYVVANEQDYHFKVLFKVLELFGYKWAKNLYHLSYAMVNLPTGKMKSREGTVVDADDLMDEMARLAVAEIKKREPKLSKSELQTRAEKIGLAAMKFYLLKHSPAQTILYNPQESISFEGATGPYLLYTYARIQSILRKSKILNPKFKINPKSKTQNSTERMINDKCQMLNSDEEWALGKLLARFNESVTESAAEYNPSKLATYLLDLAQSFNTFYHKHQVLKAKNKDLVSARLALINKVAEAIKAGLELLGIEVIEKM